MLSAQTKDARVNKVTKVLFNKSGQRIRKETFIIPQV